MKKNIRSTALLLSVLLTAGTVTGCRGDRSGKDIPGIDTDGTVTGGQADTQVSPIVDPEGDPGQTASPDTRPEPETVYEPTAGVWDGQDVTASVTLTGSDASVEGSGVKIDGSTVTFTAAGTYLVTGKLNGQLVVDTQDTEKVKLILNGVSIANADGPAVYAVSAPKKVILYTAKDSVNLLSDGTDYVVPDDQQVEGQTYPNACVYACADLKLDGEGALQINGRADKGVNTKDDLEITGGTLTVTSKGAGIRGNDSVTVSGGTVTVTSGGDGIKTAQTEKDGKGVLTVNGGALYITAAGDGLNAATDLSVADGTVVITTTDADGSTVKDTNQTSGGQSWGGRGGFPGGPGGEGNSSKSSISAKGLKAAGTITVSGGHLTLTTADDGIHSNDTVLIQDGSVWIKAGDDGIHADKVLTVSGGVTEIAQSYEGLEADKINILGGTNRVTASDDGMNASNGESGGGMPGGPGGPGGFRPGGRGGQTGGTQSADAPLLTIAGGYTVVNANGDGIDSNGSIVMTGGTMIVYGPTDNGNGPIDFGDGNYSMTVSGGTLLAVGSSGMAEAPVNNGQAAWAARTGNIKADTFVGLADADGNPVCGFRVPKLIASMVYSSPALAAGQPYTLITGGTAEADADGVIDLTTWTGYAAKGSVDAY
ncbi:MAG: carbohydrate-binding domain-containing protein [Clostridia bacterium]|nr:carbohydrate-binding domain-containing protein [Clostridia bacterium]